MRTGTRRRIALVTMTAATTLTVSGLAAASNAYGYLYIPGKVDCAIFTLGSNAFGLATDFPAVHAFNVRRYRRDVQKVAVNYRLATVSGHSWVTLGYSDWWQGWAADNNYVIVWRDARTGEIKHFPYERIMWQFAYSGWYSVSERIHWYPTRYARSADTGYHLIRHTGGSSNSVAGPAKNWCFLWSD